MTLEYVAADKLPPCPKCNEQGLEHHIMGNEYCLYCLACCWDSGWKYPRAGMDLAGSIEALVTDERRRIAKRKSRSK